MLKNFKIAFTSGDNRKNEILTIWFSYLSEVIWKISKNNKFSHCHFLTSTKWRSENLRTTFCLKETIINFVLIDTKKITLCMTFFISNAVTYGTIWFSMFKLQKKRISQYLNIDGLETIHGNLRRCQFP